MCVGLTKFSQSCVSARRMLAFLELDELEPYVNKELSAKGAAVEMVGACLGWVEPAPAEGATAKKPPVSTTSRKDTGYAKVYCEEGSDEGGTGSGITPVSSQHVLSDAMYKPGEAPHSTSALLASCTLLEMNFSIKKGDLVAVVGSFGSGKSSLLSALLGEMLLQKGSVRVHGGVAYCDQRPWILNDTVQGNILFGLPYDEQKFDAALYAANMEDDVVALSGGLNTQIGKKLSIISKSSAIFCALFVVHRAI
jgi:ABC-type multidrug transport system fused ATPase/permease subunit